MPDGRVLGARAAADLVMPSGVDSSYVLAFRIGQEQDLTAQAMISLAASTIGAKNEMIANKWRRFTYLTTAPFAYYSAGISGTRQTPNKVEYKSAEPVRSDSNGHMLPYEDFEDAMGWSAQYLRDAHLVQLESDLALIGASWENRVERQILTRMFTNTENVVGSGRSVPWAIGTGVTVPYIPPMYGGYSFDDTHTHFQTQSGAFNAANAKLLLEKMVAQLTHHGLRGRFAAFVSEADISIYSGMTGFVKFVPSDIQVIGGSTSAPVYISTAELQGSPGELFGFYLSDKGPVIELRSSERVPTTYAWLGKSFGDDNAANPIALRVHPKIGFGLRVDVVPTRSLNPELEMVKFLAGHGVAVNQRIGGVAGMGNSASWVNPTIS